MFIRIWHCYLISKYPWSGEDESGKSLSVSKLMVYADVVLKKSKGIVMHRTSSVLSGPAKNEKIYNIVIDQNCFM